MFQNGCSINKNIKKQNYELIHSSIFLIKEESATKNHPKLDNKMKRYNNEEGILFKVGIYLRLSQENKRKKTQRVISFAN